MHRQRILSNSGSMVNHTWESLVESVGAQEPSIAHRTLADGTMPIWTARPREFNGLVAPYTAAGSKALSYLLTHRDPKPYFLVVTEGNVRALFDMSEPLEMSATGGRFVAVGGDFRTVSGVVMHPGWYSPHAVTSRTGLTENWCRTKTAKAKSWEAMTGDLTANADWVVVPEATDPPGGAAPEVHAQQILPVPRWLGVMFLKPIPVRQAFERGTVIRAVIPDANRGNYAPLFDFLRVAMTQCPENGALAGRSALESQWERLVVTEGSEMETRNMRLTGKLLESLAPARAAEPDPTVPDSNTTGGGPSATDSTEKHKYNEHQCKRIWSVSGKAADTFNVLTEDAMPTFFQGLRNFRGSGVSTRQFIEDAWSAHKSTERIKTQFVFSRQLVTDIRNLEFGGQDVSYTWELRARGLSFYSLGRIALFSSARYVQVRDTWCDHENADEDKTLTMADRKANDKLSVIICETPDTQVDTMIHLEAVADRLTFLMGKECPVVTYLLWYADKIQQPRYVAWGESDWRAFNWHVHVGMRMVFTDCNNGVGKDQLAMLKRIETDLVSSRRFPIDDCPKELQPKKRSAEDAGLTGRGKAGGKGDDNKRSPGGPGGGGSDAPKSARRHPMAENFNALLKKARAGAKNGRYFNVGKVLPKAEDHAYVLGTEFSALSKEGNLCGKFLFDRCTYRECKFCHELTGTPTKTMIEGIVKRFGEKVDAYIETESKK